MKQRIIELKLSRVSRIFLFCFGECSSLFDVEIKSGAKKKSGMKGRTKTVMIYI